MSLFNEFITSITSGLFASKEESKNKKIIPKIEFEDVELGNVRKKTENYMDYCELKYIIQNPDLELGFGPTVEINCGDVVDINACIKYNVYEKYISFMESISYLATPFKDRTTVFYKM